MARLHPIKEMRLPPSNLTVAAIGLGYFSQFHLLAWQAHSDVDLVGVTDLDAARVAEVVDERGVAGFGSAEALLQATDPDVIDLVVPPGAQADLLRLCLKSGRLVICQKPFGRTLEEAMAMTNMAKAAGTTLVIHENFRFQPWHRIIKRFLEGGRMGQVYQARFALRPGDGRGARAYLDRQPTFQQMQRFLVQETAVHFIDLFRWLLGDITSVYADLRQLNPVIAGEDAGLLVLHHEGGARSVFDGNRLADHVADNPRLTMGEMEIEGEGGRLALDGFGKVTFRAFGSTETETVAITEPIDPDSFGGGCVAALIEHVVQAFRDNTVPENLAQNYLDVIRTAEAAYRSNAQGCRVSLKG